MWYDLCSCVIGEVIRYADGYWSDDLSDFISQYTVMAQYSIYVVQCYSYSDRLHNMTIDKRPRNMKYELLIAMLYSIHLSIPLIRRLFRNLVVLFVT